MRKALFTMMCLAAMLAAGTCLKAQEITIGLYPGWNWISYPNAEAMDIAVALGEFAPMQGDILTSQYGFTTYTNGRWRGSVTQFIPGWGYMYYSSRTDYVEFVFAQAASSVVATATPTDITATSAVVGGMVTLPEGSHVFLRGVCWGTASNPDIDGSHTTEGTGIGSFSDTLVGLNLNTTYFVRSYVVSEYGLAYGNVMTFTTMSGIPEVSTTEVTDITTNSAVCGGMVTDDGGLDITACGVCWSEETNPTIECSHTSEETGVGSFSSSLTNLESGTVYYVRAYVTNAQATYYGGEMIFTTLDYGYIDLGLPSGLLWATCNVGADAPEDYGDYFAWGETQTKATYNWSTYQYCHGSNTTMTKYCTNSSFGYNGFTDNLTILLPEDDAATVNWGSNWRIPTKEEWQELCDNTTQTWTTQNGVYGSLFVASNGDSLFLPAAGNYDESSLTYAGIHAFYWSSSLDTDLSRNAWRIEFNSDGYNMRGYYRYYGRSVRAVRSISQNNSFIINVIANPTAGGLVSGGGYYEEDTECTVTAAANEGYTFENWTENDIVVSTEASYSFIVNENRNLVANFTASGSGDHDYIDLGLPSGLLWATCNVGADAPEDYGDYFAWGETQTKATYNWSTYQYCHGSITTMTKYCTNSSYGYNGFTDNLTTLLPEDDAATANWGEDWRMPTLEDWQELLDNTTVTQTVWNGVNGRMFTASNGNSIFLPASGYCDGSNIDGVGHYGDYWSSSLLDNPYGAWHYYYIFDNYNLYVYGYRYYGRTIRPVRSSGQNNAPTGAVNGKFTINDNGDQVYFSQGNLQYIGSASTPYWKFADNQWDVLGTTTGQNSTSQNVDRDLFGWGTSGWNNGNTYYQPWSTAGYEESNHGQLYGPSGNNSLSGNYANADWGVYNPISNGGNQANQWRTLTQSEWAYVFNTRTTSSGIRYTKANVNNVNGVILLPDGWSTSCYTLNNTNSTSASFSSNTISATQWSTLEQHGAVFLPAAGCRDGTSVDSVGSYGNYWSASYYYSNFAYFVYFFDSYLDPQSDDNRYVGHLVRLVRFAQ